MSFNEYEPYGPVVETTMRVVTWNVWGRHGRWADRQAGIEDALVAVAPDVVCLVESWSHRDVDQPRLVAERLGFEHSVFVGDGRQEDWVSGFGLVSRWPVTSHECRALPGDSESQVGDSGSSPPISPSSPTTTRCWLTYATNPHPRLAAPPSRTSGCALT